MLDKILDIVGPILIIAIAITILIALVAVIMCIIIGITGEIIDFKDKHIRNDVTK